jgi:hypothetical protein
MRYPDSLWFEYELKNDASNCSAVEAKGRNSEEGY